jgi:hypothetical protein
MTVQVKLAVVLLETPTEGAETGRAGMRRAYIIQVVMREAEPVALQLQLLRLQ